MKKFALALVAMSVTLALAAPAAEAQYRRRSTEPPEGYVDLATQANRDGITQYMLKGADAQCQILQSYGMTGEPCERVARANVSGIWQELQNRSARYDYYAQDVSRLPIPGRYGHRGRGHGYPPWMVMHNGSRYGWMNDGFYDDSGYCMYHRRRHSCNYNYQRDRFGLYDNAALIDSVGNAVGTGIGMFFNYKLRSRQIDNQQEMMRREQDLRKQEMIFRQQQTQRQPAPQPAPITAPAMSSDSGKILTNRTKYDFVITVPGRDPLLLLAGDSMSIRNVDRLDKVKFEGACTIRKPTKDSQGGVSITCAT